MSLSTTIKSIQDIMRKDAGVDGDAQRIGQLGWMLFFKIFSDLELETELEDDTYTSPVPSHLRWDAWANEDVVGTDAPTGDALLDLVNNALFPALKDLNVADFSGRSRYRAQILRSVFEDAYNYMKSGTLMRQVINKISHEIDFNESKTRHLLGDIYEQVLRDLQGAGNAGEFYTPRAVTQFAVDMVSPRLGETVLVAACGTGGFLTAALEAMRPQADTSAMLAGLKESIRGVEKKALPHLLCVTNLMLHGVEVPGGIKHENTLARPLRDYGPDDLVDVIVTNPPFVGMEEDGIADNFPSEFRTKDTADLFLLLVTELLRERGRAAIVLPDSSLFGDGVKQLLRYRLVNEFDLHTIVRLPHGVFSPYTDIRTNILFFRKGEPTQKTWFYELNPIHGDKYTKSKPIGDADFADLRSWWGERSETERAYAIGRDEIEKRDFNLDIPNPHREDVYDAFKRASELRVTIQSDLDEMVGQLREGLDRAPWPIGARARELLTTVASLGGTAPLTSGFLDDLRLAITEIALHGELSKRNTDDEEVEETLARYTGAPSRAQRGRPEPPFPVPKHWSWARLHQVCDFQLGRTPSTKSTEYWVEAPEGIPWVSISDMPRRGIVEGTAKRISLAAQADVFRQSPVSAGTLLMAFKLSVGKTAILGMDAFHNEAIASLNVQDETFKQFLLWALPVAALHGGTNPAVRGNTLNSKSIAGLWVPVPPREEQQRVVGALRWMVSLVEEMAHLSEELRGASSRTLKLLAGARCLTTARLPAHLIDSVFE